MDKQIKFCSAQELLNNIELNKGNTYFEQTITIINGMYNYLKSQVIIQGRELPVLNNSFEEVKKSLDSKVLETIVHIKN